MPNLWLVVAACLAPINWVVSERQISLLIYLTKPAVMLALLAWIWSGGGASGPLLAFSIGALLCLVGDVFLMLPGNWFLPGLVAFLLGHISYIAGFKPTMDSFWPYGLPLAAALILIGVTVFRVLAAGLQSKGLSRLHIPVLVYILVICGMTLSALLTLSNQSWQTRSAVLVSLGALFFLSSDSLLGWNRFVRPVPHERFIVMMLYHLAQFSILIGAAWNFS